MARLIIETILIVKSNSKNMKNVIINENGIVRATIRLLLKRRRKIKMTKITIIPPSTTVSLRFLMDCMIKTVVSKNSVRTTSFGRRLLN